MKDFLNEFSYMCSSANTSSRGFYIRLAIGLSLLTLLILGAAGLIVFSLIKGIEIPVYAIIAFVVAFVIEAGLIVWLKRG
jgi:hypothetical protein